MNSIDAITDFIFVEDMPHHADIIFIPGGSYPELAERAAELWKAGIAPYILPSGQYNPRRGFFPGPKSKNEKYGSYKYDTEWEFLKEVATICGVDSNVILRENSATTTIENAFKSREVVDQFELSIVSAIICCKSYHARRTLMAYEWAFPETKFIICPVDVKNISRNNWFKEQSSIEIVMGELARCGMQFDESYFRTARI